MRKKESEGKREITRGKNKGKEWKIGQKEGRQKEEEGGEMRKEEGRRQNREYGGNAQERREEGSRNKNEEKEEEKRKEEKEVPVERQCLAEDRGFWEYMSLWRMPEVD